MIYITRENTAIVRKPMPACFAFGQAYDVIVAGCGTAAVISSLVLAEKNTNLLIIDRLNNLGGTHTNIVNGYYYGSAGGKYEAVDARIDAMMQQHGHVATLGGNAHPDVRAAAYEQALLRSGCTLSFNSWICGVYLERNRLVGIRYLDAQGVFQDAGCRLAIDGTADALLCHLSGLPTAGGRRSDGAYQPYSVVLMYCDQQSGQVHSTNKDAGYIDLDSTNEYDASIIDAYTHEAYLKDSYDSTDQYIRFAPLLGVRESRRIISREQMDFQDFLTGKKSDQPLFYIYSNFDNHTKDLAFEDDLQNDWVVAMNLWGVTASLGVPLGALIPRDIDGVLVAGRHLGVDHIMAAHARMMRDMQKLGEAVGEIAAYALEHNCLLTEIDRSAILEKLRQSGCYDPADDLGIIDARPKGTGQPVLYPRDLDGIRQLLASDRPGLGMLAALRLAARIDVKSSIRQWFAAGEETLRYNCACLLALLDDDTGESILLEAARTRDRKRLETSRKYNHDRGMTAVYLLGRLGSCAAIPLLCDLISRRELLRSDPIEFDEYISNIDDHQFQYLSHAVRALGSIARLRPEEQGFIHHFLQEKILQDPFPVFVTLKASTTRFDLGQRIRDYVRHILQNK